MGKSGSGQDWRWGGELEDLLQSWGKKMIGMGQEGVRLGAIREKPLDRSGHVDLGVKEKNSHLSS